METQTSNQLIQNKPIETALAKLRPITEEGLVLEKQKVVFVDLLLKSIRTNLKISESESFWERINDEEFMSLAEDALERSRGNGKFFILKFAVFRWDDIQHSKSDLALMEEVLRRKGVDVRELIIEYFMKIRKKGWKPLEMSLIFKEGNSVKTSASSLDDLDRKLAKWICGISGVGIAIFIYVMTVAASRWTVH